MMTAADSTTPATADPTPLVRVRGLSAHHGRKTVLHGLDFDLPAGRVVGLLGHNGAGKTTLLRCLVGLMQAQGEVQVLGHHPRHHRAVLLQSLCYIPDVAVLPRWARVDELIRLMAGLHPRFSAERARALLRRTSIGPSDTVRQLSRGMVVQLHLALMAAIDARLMILDEPTLGLDVLSRKHFYDLLLDEWCDGERTVLISTHQVEEVEALLSDVLILNEGRLVLNISLEQIDQRFVSLRHDPSAAALVGAAQPLAQYQRQGQSSALFDGAPPDNVAALGQRMRPKLVDLFIALTRAPELNSPQR